MKILGKINLVYYHFINFLYILFLFIIRLLSDATVEKMESHPGKIVERKWYERNKHIFPASRWEIYDPSNPSKYTNYTIKGNN